MSAAPELSVLIATRNRRDGLRRVLADLQLSESQLHAAPSGRERESSRVETIVIDNGSSDGTAELLRQWSAGHDARHSLCVPLPGRSRALNAGAALARGRWLAFTDDDVLLPPQWIEATLSFFARHPEVAASMGRVQIPPDERTPELDRLANLYRGTLPLFDEGDEYKELDVMYGCAMTVERTAFVDAGGFDERLGVGASGLCEDIDIARRLRRRGWRIGYNPEAVLYHTVDVTRLTVQAYRDFQLRDARSRYLMEPGRAWIRPFLRGLEAWLAQWMWAARGADDKRLWAWGRAIRQLELARLYRQGPGGNSGDQRTCSTTLPK